MGGSTKTTQASSSEPWAAAQPILKQGLNDAQALYSNGKSFQPYGGSTVVPYSNQSTVAMGNMGAFADAAQPSFYSNFGNIAANNAQGGLNAPQQTALQQMQGFAAGAGGVPTGNFQNLYTNAGGPSYSEQYLKNIASGGMLNREDPNFERVLGRATENASTAGGMQAAAAGRYGSGMGQKAVATAVGDLEANARLGQYNQERANQMSATGMLDQGRNANFANQLNAANALASYHGSNTDRRMNAATSAFNAGQQQQQNLWNGTNALSNAYNAASAPAQSKLGVGQMQEDLAGRTLNDQLRMWQGQQDAPKNALQWLQAIGSGAGSLGGSGSTTAQGPSASPFGQVLGGALGLNSLFGGL